MNKIINVLDEIGFLMNMCGTQHIAEILKRMKEIKFSDSYNNIGDVESLFNEVYSNYIGRHEPHGDWWGGTDNNWKYSLVKTTNVFSENFRPTGINHYRLLKFLPNDFMQYFELNSQNNFDNINLICVIYEYLQYLYPFSF